MKINWKHLSITPGYKSLKSAYIKDVQDAAKQKHPMRDKSDFLKKFNWVINRAKHYSHVTGKTIDSVLNEWEEARTCWWLNYYQDCNQPKKHSNSLKPQGINGLRKYYKTCFWSTPYSAKRQVNLFIQKEHEKNSKKIKKRWTSIAKIRRNYFEKRLNTVPSL